MNESMQAVRDSKPEKKTFLRMLGKFLMYGGWLLVLFVVLIVVMFLSGK